MPVRYGEKAESAGFSAGKLFDLSRCGCGIRMQEQISIESQLYVEVRAETKIRFSGKVRHCTSRRKLYHVGIEFDPLNSAQQSFLQLFLGDAYDARDDPFAES